MKHGGEVYADFTTNRIVRALEHSEPLSDNQCRDIRRVLVAEQASQKHYLDFRIFIPLFFSNYYLCFFAGRDRRKSTLSVHSLRLSRTTRRLSRSLLYVFLVILSFVLGTAVFWGLYRLKSMMGIDLVPNWHFSEFVSDLGQTVLEIF